jgi:hypothetical protein
MSDAQKFSFNWETGDEGNQQSENGANQSASQNRKMEAEPWCLDWQLNEQVESLGGEKIQKQQNQGRNLRSAPRKMNASMDQWVEIGAGAVSKSERRT